jgi:hypothetical protein
VDAQKATADTKAAVKDVTNKASAARNKKLCTRENWPVFSPRGPRDTP